MLKLEAPNLSYPGVVWCPLLGFFCPNFQINHTSLKTTMMRLWRPRDLSWILFARIPAYDRGTYGHDYGYI